MEKRNYEKRRKTFLILKCVSLNSKEKKESVTDK